MRYPPAWRYLPPVGFFDRFASWLNVSTRPNDLTAPASLAPSSTGIRSPWVSGNLTKIAVADILGTDALPVTRAEAMSIPAIARARHILAADAARCPLEVLTAAGGASDPGAAGWLQSTRLNTSPQHRMVWTVDDLIFYGWSLWVVKRDEDRAILDGARCPVEWWKFGPTGEILINDNPVPEGSVVLIPGFHEGVITTAVDTVRGSRRLEEVWQDRAANPIPATELHQTTPDTMTDDEVASLVNDWTVALRQNGGAVGWTPMSIDVRTHGDGATDLLVQGRNAAAVDGARHVGVPAAMVDASNVNASLTYETTQGRNLEYLDRSLALYLGPVEARLSLDDVTPPGSRVRANTDALTSSLPLSTGAPMED